MRRFLLVLFCLVAISGFVFYFVSVRKIHLDGHATGGVLDLRGADLNRNAFSLDGEWEFYWNRLYTPDDFAAESSEEKRLIAVPSSWTAAGYPTFGYGTYRLKLLTGNIRGLMIYIPEITSASAIWMNGRRVAASGRIGTSGIEAISARSNHLIALPKEDGMTEIVVQVSNFEQLFVSGLRFQILIGRDAVLQRALVARWTALAGVVGAFVVMGLYHLMLFLFPRGAKGEVLYLIFTVSCLLTGARLLLEPNSLLIYLLPGGERFWFEITNALLALHGILAILFSLAVFELRPGRFVKALYITIFALIIVAKVLPSGLLKYRLVYLLYIPFLTTIVQAARAFVMEPLENRHWQGLYLGTLIFFALWSPFANIILQSRFFAANLFSNVFLMLVQVTILSQNYAEARRRAGELAEENRMLDRLNVMKNRFWANMSHEMRTPLTLMSANAQLVDTLLRRGESGKEAHAALVAVKQEASRLARMAKDAMDLTSDGEERVGKAVIDLPRLLQATAGACHLLLKKRGNRLFLDVADDLPAVAGNADRVTQVILNLLTNANEHTKNGEITVRSAYEKREDGGWILTEIRDTGKGIAPELLPRIFERGVRGESSEGAGFGLYICRALVERYGGHIWLESEPGRGTGVFFRLPALRGGENHEKTADDTPDRR